MCLSMRRCSCLFVVYVISISFVTCCSLEDWYQCRYSIRSALQRIQDHLLDKFNRDHWLYLGQVDGEWISLPSLSCLSRFPSGLFLTNSSSCCFSQPTISSDLDVKRCSRGWYAPLTLDLHSSRVVSSFRQPSRNRFDELIVNSVGLPRN